MKRVLTTALALLALAVPLAPAALASAAQISDVQRPSEAVAQTLPPLYSRARLFAPKQTVVPPQVSPEPLRLENR